RSRGSADRGAQRLVEAWLEDERREQGYERHPLKTVLVSRGFRESAEERGPVEIEQQVCEDHARQPVAAEPEQVKACDREESADRERVLDRQEQPRMVEDERPQEWIRFDHQTRAHAAPGEPGVDSG